MKLIECERCGSASLFHDQNYVVCEYCRSRYLRSPDEVPPVATTLDLASDIRMLLERCRLEPANVHQFANLILDIDPSNQEALRYLNPKRKRK